MQYVYRTFVSIVYLEINFNVDNTFYRSTNPNTWGERSNPRKQCSGLFWKTARGRKLKKKKQNNKPWYLHVYREKMAAF